MSLRVVLWLVVLAFAAAPLASAEPLGEEVENVDFDLELLRLRAQLGLGDVPTVTADAPGAGFSVTAGAPTLETVWYVTSAPWDEESAPREDAKSEDRSGTDSSGSAAEDERRDERPVDAYCAPRPSTGPLDFGVLPRVCVPVLADPAPLLQTLPAGVLPDGLPLGGAPGAAAPSNAADNGAAVETAAAGIPGAEPLVATGALLAVAGVAAVAAGSALTPAGSLAWDRLKRLVVGAALYTRLTRESILSHDTRDAIFAALKAKPGSAIADLATEAGVPRNTATHHLHMLEKQNLVSSIRKGRVRLYFPTGSPEERRSASAIAVLRHETTSAVARAIGAAPGLDQGTLCVATGVAPSLAHWHVSRLVESGVVTQVRDGRRVRYYPGEVYHRVMNDALLGPGA